MYHCRVQTARIVPHLLSDQSLLCEECSSPHQIWRASHGDHSSDWYQTRTRDKRQVWWLMFRFPWFYNNNSSLQIHNWRVGDTARAKREYIIKLAFPVLLRSLQWHDWTGNILQLSQVSPVSCWSCSTVSRSWSVAVSSMSSAVLSLSCRQHS